MRLPRAAIPSGGLRRPRRRVRLVALLSVRDGMRYLPGWFANVGPHVDGVVALDDGSTDGSREFLAARPEVVELIVNSPDRPVWDEMGNHRQLHAAALRAGADWALVVDVDERIEMDFRSRAERVIRRGGRFGKTSFAVRLRELWDVTDRWRGDGVWGRKTAPRLFLVRPDHEFDDAAVHGIKAPLQDRPYAIADLHVYHLGVLTPVLRERRRARHAGLAPDGNRQPMGDDHADDEVQLRPIPWRRRWVD